EPQWSSIYSLSFSSDGSEIAVVPVALGKEVNQIKRYHYKERSAIDPLLGHEAGPQVYRIFYSPHDRTLAVSHQNGLVYLYPLDRPGNPVLVHPAVQPVAWPALAFAPDRPVLAVAVWNEIRWWNLPRAAWEDRILFDEKKIRGLAYTPDGKYLA